MKKYIIYIAILLIPFAAFALTAEERMADPEQEKRAHAIFKQIRCVVCSGESINDSKADIAKSLRVLIRDKLAQGMRDKEIIDYISERYGDAVLMRPPFNANTLILWLGPLLILVIGGSLVVKFFLQKLGK